MSDQPAGAEEAELVDDQRVDRVGLRRRQQRLLRVPGDRDQRLPEAFAEEAAVGLGEDRLEDLVAAAVRVVCRGAARFRPGRGRAARWRRRTRRRRRNIAIPMTTKREAAGGDVEQGEEGGEEHQRAAEVADEDEHEHRGAPDDQHRPEVLERRQGDAEDPPRADDQHLAVLAQVAGEEDDDRDLRELGRLEGERADLDPEVGAVDLLADPRQARRQQQQQPDRGDRCSGSARAPRSRAGTGSSARRGRARSTNQLAWSRARLSSIR